MQLERRGIATATIVTSGFVAAAEAHRKLLERPDLPYFVVPHPIVSMSDRELQASADAIAPGIVEALGQCDSRDTEAASLEPGAP